MSINNLLNKYNFSKNELLNFMQDIKNEINKDSINDMIDFLIKSVDFDKQIIFTRNNCICKLLLNLFEYLNLDFQTPIKWAKNMSMGIYNDLLIANNLQQIHENIYDYNCIIKIINATIKYLGENYIINNNSINIYMGRRTNE